MTTQTNLRIFSDPICYILEKNWGIQHTHRTITKHNKTKPQANQQSVIPLQNFQTIRRMWNTNWIWLQDVWEHLYIVHISLDIFDKSKLVEFVLELMTHIYKVRLFDYCDCAMIVGWWAIWCVIYSVNGGTATSACVLPCSILRQHRTYCMSKLINCSRQSSMTAGFPPRAHTRLSTIIQHTESIRLYFMRAHRSI